MKILAIDTSIKRLSMAISQQGKVTNYRNMILDRVMSTSFVPALNRLLKSANLKLNEIDVFVIGLGPGSFTSLRVGMSAVKGMAFALNKPVIGISSLDAIAYRSVNKQYNGDQDICVITDAKRKMVYAAIYESIENGVNRKTDYLLLPIDDLLAKIKKSVLFVGDGIELYRDNIKLAFAKPGKHMTVDFAPDSIWMPDARALCALATARLAHNEFDDVKNLVPLYLYPEDCQVQK